MLESDHPALIYLQRDLNTFQDRLNRLRGGKLKFGTSVDQWTWTDTTAEEIDLCEARIDELKKSIISFGA
jgi:hypothetical protein